MIVVYSNAGLANRMFHYALYKALEVKGIDVYFDEKSYVPEWSFETTTLMDVFPNIQYRESLQFKRASKKTFLDKIVIHCSNLFGGRYYVNYRFKYDDKLFTKLETNQDLCLIGLWQSEKYFMDVRQEIQKCFQYRSFVDDKNVKTAQQMLSENSVAIHVRKGEDYQQNRIWKNTCTIDYYRLAIDYIRMHVQNPVFYVFTDNKDWVIENFTDLDYTLCDWNPTSGKQNYLDMQLMSCAKHNVIANSTYSWWGAWLNENSDKIVIAPKRWFNKIVTPDILPEQWIKI